MKTVRIGEKNVGDGNPCFIMAEAGCNHNQELELAKRLVDQAAKARADGVKFQTYRAENMYSRKTPMMAHFKERLSAPDGATMYDLIKMTELPYDFHEPITTYCRQKGVPFFSTPFSEGDVDYLEQLDLPAYKIASFEMTHFPLIRRAASTGRPVILSTGMSTLGDIERVLAIFEREGNDRVILLHCVSNYPCRPEDTNLRVIETLKRTFGFPVGLSDHTPGIEVAKIAIAVGANLVEKHITTDQGLPGPDHYFSLTAEELSALVCAAREIEAMLGSSIKRCTDAELDMKRIGRRSLVAATAIPRGSKITTEMLAERLLAADKKFPAKKRLKTVAPGPAPATAPTAKDAG